MATPINSTVNKKLDEFLAKWPLYKKYEIVGYAISMVIDYHEKVGRLPTADRLAALPAPSADLGELSALAAGLPGMSEEVIHSHLVRFPRLTGEDYREIIQELRRLQADGALKNAEATAYGLAKKASKAGGWHASTRTAAATAPADDLSDIPEEALRPY